MKEIRMIKFSRISEMTERKIIDILVDIRKLQLGVVCKIIYEFDICA